MVQKIKYIVAVSGGIDSVVLLDVMSHQDGEVIVAHVDHGIREDSADDARFVQTLAERYGCLFEASRLELGAGASEEAARSARYEILYELKRRYEAETIMTAHHADDVLETMAINCLRGSGWRGLSSLRSHPAMQRPLLEWSKVEIVRYAIEHSLRWREDSTNDDIRYLRNWLRHGMMGKLDAAVREKLLGLAQRQSELVNEIDSATDEYIRDNTVSRYWLIMVADEVAQEVLRALIIRHTGITLLSSQLRRSLLFVKSGRAGKTMRPAAGIDLHLTTDRLIVVKG